MEQETRMPDNLTALVDRHPQLNAADILASLTPPQQFNLASFDNYIPDADYPSQESTREILRTFAQGSSTVKPAKLFGRKVATQASLPGVYLDGGFGVGKTHLLAALWHASAGRKKFFGTFLQYTSLVGALGYQNTIEAMSGASLICIDEFELDDPGDTMVMTRLLGELISRGTRVAATSNTPPHALGEGRFAAADFLREIHAMAANFETIRIDGTDYRKRTASGEAAVVSEKELSLEVSGLRDQGLCVTLDGFDEVLAHLASVHPSTYVRLISGVDVIALSDVHVLLGQTDALRFVAFIDRVYDAQISLRSSGVPLSTIFGGDMINGGYRKKYLRCISRLIALTNSQVG
jgi:cell division protein ZapE